MDPTCKSSLFGASYQRILLITVFPRLSTELLLEKGYEVHGIIRRSSSFNTGRLHHLYEVRINP